ncbi:hypothetical protein BU14_0084s0001 [Porphyra umbilicalis]|uniref:Uncharacterized protein n=1 Tax=Porphyra umbilicalis TaxID=2786 RepID=A0A1X6PEA4_PORUM|nr:hypothetical protein BU14_0084s0001 [Porphyra umbilicalis]|eukprot:OSX79187.1 hypothetical protein BU14_0084s0001 [Porphyra umbilicalis]
MSTAWSTGMEWSARAKCVTAIPTHSPPRACSLSASASSGSSHNAASPLMASATEQSLSTIAVHEGHLSLSSAAPRVPGSRPAAQPNGPSPSTRWRVTPRQPQPTPPSSNVLTHPERAVAHALAPPTAARRARKPTRRPRWQAASDAPPAAGRRARHRRRRRRQLRRGRRQHDGRRSHTIPVGANADLSQDERR